MADFPALPLWTDALLADTAHLDHAELGLYMRLLILMWRTPGCSIPDDPAWIAKRLNTPFEQIEPILREFCSKTGGRGGGRITQKRLLKEFTYLRENSKKQSQRAKSGWAKRDAKVMENRQNTASEVHENGVSLSEQNTTSRSKSLKQNNTGLRKSQKEPTLKSVSFGEQNPDLFDKALETNDLDLCRSDAETMPPHPHLHHSIKKKNIKKKKVSDEMPYSSDFEEAWRTYRTSPTMSKAKAWQAWLKAITLCPPDQLIAAIKAYNAHLQANGTEQKFVAHMTTWLNERRFEGFLANVEQANDVQVDEKRMVENLAPLQRAIHDKLGSPIFRSWFKDAEIVEQPGERPGTKAFALRFPTGFMAQYCKQHYLDAVCYALETLTRSRVDVFFEARRAKA